MTRRVFYAMIAIRGKEGKNNCHISQAETDIMRQYILMFIRFMKTGYGLFLLPFRFCCSDWMESVYAYYTDFY